MALAATVNRSHLETSPFNPIVKNGSTQFKGGFMGLEAASGHSVPLADQTGVSFIGEALDTVVGNGVKTAGVIFTPYILKNAAVTGYAAVTDNWKPVYATADDTLTLTRPADDAQVVGVTTRFNATGVGDVLMLGALHSAVHRLSGGDKEEIILGYLTAALIIDTNVVTKTLYGRGKIVKIFCRAMNAVTTAAKATTMTGRINGTTITDGALTVTSAGQTPDGAEQSVTPSGANEFSDGDVFTGVFGTTTVFVEGVFEIGIVVQRLP